MAVQCPVQTNFKLACAALQGVCTIPFTAVQFPTEYMLNIQAFNLKTVELDSGSQLY